MSIKNLWIRRTIAATAVTMTALVAGSPDADAATTSSSFDVTATVFGNCAISAAPLTFAGYTTGQTSDVDGATTITVSCPGAASSPLPVQLSLSTPTTAYAMTDGAGHELTYGLYSDAPGSTMFSLAAGDPGATYAVNAATYTVNIFGRIFANQTSPVGSYAQTVTATLTY